MLSIESQRGELQRYAERENLTIVAVLEESKSAKAPGRPVFNDLLKRIQRGEADGILAWHPDRLARNALDGGMVIHLLDMGKLKSMRFPTYTFENTSQGKFMLAIMFGQSKYYVDSLSENIRRGNRTKRERGWSPSRLPIGYLNAQSSSGEKIIVSDPDRFPAIKRLWQLMESGAYSVPELHRIAASEFGIRTLKRKRMGGGPLSLSGLYRTLCNPFYAAQIAHGGEWYPGKHEQMVTIAQFERVQTLLGKPNRPRPKEHSFAFTGLIRCGTCGASITAQAKVNRHGSHYTYYHCARKKPGHACPELSLEEKQLESQLLGFLNRAHLTEADTNAALTIIDQQCERERLAGYEPLIARKRALDRCRAELDTLTKIRYRDLIGDEEFTRQRVDLLRQEAALKQDLASASEERRIEPSRNFFLFNNRAAFWMAHGNTDEKRLILATVGCHPTIVSKKLNIDARYPFTRLAEPREFSDWWSIVNDVRTFYLTEPGLIVPLLPDPNSVSTMSA